jgi:hypothetical protein
MLDPENCKLPYAMDANRSTVAPLSMLNVLSLASGPNEQICIARVVHEVAGTALQR